MTVTIVDRLGSPVAGAGVSGAWAGGQSAGCTTGSSGTCSFSTNLSKKVATATWTVGEVTYAAFAYVPAANLENEVLVIRP